MFKKIIKKIRLVKFTDYLKIIFIFPVALISSIFYRKINKNIVLIGESRNEARDNGYWLFKYITDNNRDINVYYVINFKSPDYKKVCNLGNCVHFGSLKHWIFYLSAKIIASSQKGDNPCSPLFYVLQNKGLLKSKFIFLQHGITISDAEWLYYDNTHFDAFICGAYPEYLEIKDKYGYPSNSVKYLGFPRFDNLHSFKVKDNQILIMPSWREWLTSKTEAYYKFGEGFDFEKSEYYKSWNSFLNSRELKLFIEENNLKILFYPHRNLQKHINKFTKISDNIKFASWENNDIQKLLMESAILITDYSSVFMDFSYMMKPTIYYQFDYTKFREGQYAEGYFDYSNGFGPAVYNEKDLINELKKSYSNKFKLQVNYENKINNFFKLRDRNNSKRNYEFIIEMLK